MKISKCKMKIELPIVFIISVFGMIRFFRGWVKGKRCSCGTLDGFPNTRQNRG